MRADRESAYRVPRFVWPCSHTWQQVPDRTHERKQGTERAAQSMIVEIRSRFSAGAARSRAGRAP
eukprot:1345139-Prymnesium_polylepis.2